MIELIGCIMLVGAIFVFSIAVAQACDPTPIKIYYIVWQNDLAQRYSEVIEARNAASAWKKLCRKHPIDKPRRLVSIKEI